MTRSRAAARAAGTRFEGAVAAFLTRVTGSDFIERRRLAGSSDRGDVGGVRTRDGARVTIEAKDRVKLDLAGALAEVEAERVNDGALVGVAVLKKRGSTAVADSYWVMDGLSFAALLTGVRPDRLPPKAGA